MRLRKYNLRKVVADRIRAVRKVPAGDIGESLRTRARAYKAIKGMSGSHEMHRKYTEKNTQRRLINRVEQARNRTLGINRRTKSRYTKTLPPIGHASI